MRPSLHPKSALVFCEKSFRYVSVRTIRTRVASSTRPLSAPVTDTLSVDTAPSKPIPPTVCVIQQWKYPTRGGQNLSERYARLERSLRGKEAYGARIEVLRVEAEGAVGIMAERSEEESARRLGGGASGKRVQTFKGLVIPEEPRAPESEECCMSGCAICVYDLYTEALADYSRSIETIRKSLSARRVPEDRWPASIRSSPKEDTDLKAKRTTANVSLSTFEVLERRLRAKHETVSVG
ncbi:hypothetical protein BKA93DRAFT_730170 [Sparassis latifolia]